MLYVFDFISTIEAKRYRASTRNNPTVIPDDSPSQPDPLHGRIIAQSSPPNSRSKFYLGRPADIFPEPTSVTLPNSSPPAPTGLEPEQKRNHSQKQLATILVKALVNLRDLNTSESQPIISLTILLVQTNLQLLDTLQLSESTLMEIEKIILSQSTCPSPFTQFVDYMIRMNEILEIERARSTTYLKLDPK